MDECYAFDQRRVEDWLIRREGPALWSSAAPYSPLFHTPSMPQLCRFIHRHMRHGTIPLDAMLQRVEQLRLDEATDWLERMQLTAMQFASVFAWLPSSPLSTVLGQQLAAVQEQRTDFTGWLEGWLKLLTSDTRLELLPQRDDWQLWQYQLQQIEHCLAAVRQVEELQPRAKSDIADITRRIHQHTMSVCPEYSQARPYSDRLSCLEHRHLHTSFFDDNLPLVQVVSASFEELVLDPDTDVVVLYFNEVNSSAVPLSSSTLLAPLLVNLHAICSLLLRCTPPQTYSTSNEHNGNNTGEPLPPYFKRTKHSSLRFAVMDCAPHVNEASVDWIPVASRRYWHGFSSAALVSYPAMPKAASLAYADYDQSQQPRPSDVDWMWAGRIMHQWLGHSRTNCPWVATSRLEVRVSAVDRPAR